MITITDLETTLGYSDSPHYALTTSSPDADVAHLFRIASDMGVVGIYSLQASLLESAKQLSSKPFVYIAEVETDEQARVLHQRLWNLCFAPFIVVLVRTVSQIRIYTGFKYAENDTKVGLIESISSSGLSREDILVVLNVFTAMSLDSGAIWQSDMAIELEQKNRVDKSLLRSLQTLGKALRADGLHEETANALIGKYVYLKYLVGRGYISDTWLYHNGIEKEDVFSQFATVEGLQKLVRILDQRLNGHIFSIDFDQERTLLDRHVSWVASIFSGDRIQQYAPETIIQLALPFQAYDFQYIPVEVLSSIYEQFILEPRKKGAFYTPEFLADYLLSEIESVRKIERGIKILDPSCGSGIFLVLAYKKIIESEIRRLGRQLQPEELQTILLESMYGVERELGACYVTEFSLLLTMMHYMDDYTLQTLQEPFPNLHNTHIFHTDFFDDQEDYTSMVDRWKFLQYDIIVGNPPWIELKGQKDDEIYARTWLKTHQTQHPVGGNNIAEAFSWRVVQYLAPSGVIGLLLKATSLYNIESKLYRQLFFQRHQVLQITDFSNLREVLFDGRAELPTVSMVYQPWDESSHEKTDILYYGPFQVNQPPISSAQPWMIVINEDEVQQISSTEAATGETSVWKLALWGNYRDKALLRTIKQSFPDTLGSYCQRYDLLIRQGSELRDATTYTRYPIQKIPNLIEPRFNTDKLRKSVYRYHVPEDILEELPENEKYFRLRAGSKSLALRFAPHIIISPAGLSYIIYSDKPFLIPSRQIGIAGDNTSQQRLKALALFLSSALVTYYLFFHAPEWGIFRQARLITLKHLKEVPIPDFTVSQIQVLADCYDQIVAEEHSFISNILDTIGRNDNSPLHSYEILSSLPKAEKKDIETQLEEFRQSIKARINAIIYSMLEIPSHIQITIQDFVTYRLPLDSPAVKYGLKEQPSLEMLRRYADQLQNSLNEFVDQYVVHSINIIQTTDIIECVVEIAQTPLEAPCRPIIQQSPQKKIQALSDIHQHLRTKLSQWVYLQRGLWLFDGPRIYIYKQSRTIHWTESQAMDDAGDIIGRVLL